LKSPPVADKDLAPDDQVVNQFFEDYVMYPANANSSPGFLEHLPFMFNEVPINNKTALRWAVRAASFASMSKKTENPALFEKAMKCYGLALGALTKALRSNMGTPDDFTLMTVVVLDIFEAIHLGTDPSRKGQHAEGMKQILRLRGKDQIYSARGWSLFRLAHHRVQQQQLTHRQEPMEESAFWLDSLNDELPEVQVERANHEVVKICDRAKQLLGKLSGPGASTEEVLSLIREIHQLDQTGTRWRTGPNWNYRNISRLSLPQDDPVVATLPHYMQLHTDVWIAYEFNYNRTARIMMHTRFMEIVAAVGSIDQPEVKAEVDILKAKSRSVIQDMADEILATAPQSLGDIDKDGRIIHEEPTFSARGIGAYFLLWPAKTVKYNKYITVEQQQFATKVIERIRDVTGMKETLGELSTI
jgi:hypothetical protein